MSRYNPFRWLLEVVGVLATVAFLVSVVAAMVALFVAFEIEERVK